MENKESIENIIYQDLKDKTENNIINILRNLDKTTVMKIKELALKNREIFKENNKNYKKNDWNNKNILKKENLISFFKILKSIKIIETNHLL
jgi:hypothetical protein